MITFLNKELKSSQDVKGLNFDEAFSNSIVRSDELKIRFLHLDDLIKAKKAAGRFKDLDDIEQLTKK